MPPVLAGILGAMERFQQRHRQNDDFNNWHEATSCKFPERRLRNVVAPEGLPSCDGRPVKTKQLRKDMDPARRWTLPHGADQIKPLKEDTPCEGFRSITLIDDGYRQNLK
jgi:hypothetical protein